MLTGKAKTEYQREYMRKRRAAQAQAKGAAATGPASATIEALQSRVAELEAALAARPATIDPSTLPKSSREKLAILQRKFENEKAMWEADFNRRVYDRAEEMQKKWIEETLIPKWGAQHAFCETYNPAESRIPYRQPLREKEYNLLRKCAHPDRLAADGTVNVSKEELTEALAILNDKKKTLMRPDQAPKAPAFKKNWKKSDVEKAAKEAKKTKAD